MKGTSACHVALWAACVDLTACLRRDSQQVHPSAMLDVQRSGVMSRLANVQDVQDILDDVRLPPSSNVLTSEQFKTYRERKALRYSSPPWQHDIFKREDVGKHMLFAGCNGSTATGMHVPDAFQGLWWMDDDSSPQTVISFSRAYWESSQEACKNAALVYLASVERETNTITSPYNDTVPCQGRMILSFWEDRMLALPYTWTSHVYEEIAVRSNFHYEYVCGGDTPSNLTICKIGSYMGPQQGNTTGLIDAIKQASVQAYNLYSRSSSVQVDANYWIRYVKSGFEKYHIKRIIDCNGLPVEPNWQQFVSGGTKSPVDRKDVYGNGGDTRSHVANVPAWLSLRWNGDPSPNGSGALCSSLNGRSCAIFGCGSSSHGTCTTVQVSNSTYQRCTCGVNECGIDGACVPRCVVDGTCPPPGCSKMTGGFCTFSSCAESRNSTCSYGRCMCPEGTCAEAGTCSTCYKHIGRTCALFSCSLSRRAVCQRGLCKCGAGMCSTGTHCVARAPGMPS
eukprot:TRINITY_DN47952_c0_g1_i1.p1 TRINITY_DN47952_c0_g1~~TRINITY_DN47952_c0_g1_i1.p1  ORF type:complete len:508 (+),score=49.30 TRINITY_DN47952_c0_g1_i1:87-1610(+)